MNSKRPAQSLFSFVRSRGFRFALGILTLLAVDLVVSEGIRTSADASRERWYLALLIMTFAFMVCLWLWFKIERLHKLLEGTQAESAVMRAANQQKSLFLAYTSHELRAPLSAIMGFTQLMKNEATTDEDRAYYLDIMQKTGEDLLAIINDILDLAKVEAGHLEVHKSRLSLAVVFQELGRLRPASEQVQFEVNLPPGLNDQIFTDGQRLRQILLNLVTNSFKFTERGKVSISVEGSSNFVDIKVADTGIGIRKEDQKRLFQTFTQFDSQGPNLIQGTGIGLTLSRNLARLLGGDLKLLTSGPGQGSCFVLSLPRGLPADAVPAASEMKKDLGDYKGLLARAKKVLLVDDSAINRLLLCRVLHTQGIAVQTATNGEEGMREALNDTYDAVLMDVQMPVMDGHEATRRLRRLGYDRPIIALTAQAMVEDRQRCLQAGCNDYLSKPVQFDHLFETLARTIEETDPATI